MKRVLLSTIAAWTSMSCFAAEPTATSLTPTRASLSAEAVSAADRRTETARTWVDSSSRFRVEATLIWRDVDSVTLRKEDGVVVDVPIGRLSRLDQLYLEQLAHEPPGMIRRGAQAIADAASVLAHVASPLTGLEDRAGRHPKSHVTPAIQLLQRVARVLEPPPLPADVVYVHISHRAISKALRQRVNRHSAVNETIVGTPVQGTAYTLGWTGLRLVPEKNRAVVDLLFQGQVHSQTTGFGGPVRVHSSGITDFYAVKRLILDTDGAELMPARVMARTSTVIQGVSTDLPRLRGRIARRIGGQRAAEMKPAAEAESARKAESQIARQFDNEVTHQLFSSRTKLSQLLTATPIDRDLLDGSVRFATSDDYLHLVLYRPTGHRARMLPPTPAQLGSPEVAVHIHSSLVNRVLRTVELRQSLEPFIAMLMADPALGFVGIMPAEPEADFRQSTDGDWWSLVVRPLDVDTEKRRLAGDFGGQH